MSDAVFETIARALRDASGLVLAPEQNYLLSARLAPILRRWGLPDLAALARCLGTTEGAGLLREAAEATTTNETSFFRDGTPFRHLAGTVLPRLAAARPDGAPIRIWSAACSSGQEAYSIAMLAAETPPPGPYRLEILGTDLSGSMVARAQRGVFTRFETQRGLSPARLARWFRAVEEGYEIAPELRATCRFRQLNLIAEAGAVGRFDVIFLRNVLIYFDTATKERVLETCARQLAPDGILYLGATESLLGLRSRLVPLPDRQGFRLAGSGDG